MLIDAHCHLDWFREPGRVVERANGKGVGAIVSCSTDLGSITKNLALAEKFKPVFACVGLHPGDALRMKRAEIEKAVALVRKRCGEAVAIGEVGLDYKYAKSEPEKKRQETVFLGLIEIAKEKNLPLVVHSRLAEKKTMQTLRAAGAEKVLMHWFTNSIASVKMAEDFGYFYTAGLAVIYSKSAAAVCAGMRPENLMLETDAPVEFGGEKAEPSWIPKVAERVAEIQGAEKGEIEKATTRNAQKFFGIPAKK